MLLRLTDDQEFFRDTTARFLLDQVPAAEVRRLRDDPAGFGDEYWTRGAELGWTSLLVDEAHGGGSMSDAGLLDLTLVADAFGRRAAPGPLIPTNVVAATLSDVDGVAWSAVLEALLTGASVATWCLAEPVPNAGLGTITLDVRVDGADVVLHGTKRPVESADQADHLLVTGRTGDGLTQVLVPHDAPGVSVTPLRTLDLTRRFSVVSFDDVRLPASTVVGEVAQAGTQVERQLQRAIVLGNAESVGAMQAGFDMTSEWAFDRFSFGRPLASYQALKYRFADMLCWLEASHAIADESARAVATEAPEAGELVSAAKAYIGHFGSELLQDCVQMHGGIGVTFEHDLHLFLRRHTVDRAMYGTPSEHRQRLTDLVQVREEARVSTDALETVDAFRARARAWIREHLKPVGPTLVTLRDERTDEEELAAVARDREVQRMLFDAGLAGVCVPRDYGGQGLTPAHQLALAEELEGYEYPMRFQVPTFSPCAAVLLDFGTEEQKRRHIPAILKGEELWMQFLSEPSGGSDVAGALTTAVRDGDEWILNGSKVWTTGAWWSDWGLCLARTNWDVPKHRGLSVFMFPIRQEGIEVHRIEMLNGNKEFCQEFLSDVRVPDTDRIGEVDDGWTVGTRWMFHERMLYNSPLVTFPVGTLRTGEESMLAVARDAGRLDDPVARDLVGEARMLEAVGDALRRRVGEGIAAGALSDQASAVARLFGGVTHTRRATIALELAGDAGAAWLDDDGPTAVTGNDFLMRQVSCIGGGTTEMARNVISERVLGMPRERTLDRDVAFRDVPRSAPAG